MAEGGNGLFKHRLDLGARANVRLKREDVIRAGSVEASNLGDRLLNHGGGIIVVVDGDAISIASQLQGDLLPIPRLAPVTRAVLRSGMITSLKCPNHRMGIITKLRERCSAV